MTGPRVENLVRALCQADAYPHPIDGNVRVVETHISWVFLAGAFAYKVKKPVRTSFLDYSTLPLRRHFCYEELRLNQRYSHDLYLAVVPIVAGREGVRVAGEGETVEYAVKMCRFPDDALASTRLARGWLTMAEVRSLATRIAQHHAQAAVAPSGSRFGSPDLVLEEALDNVRDLAAAKVLPADSVLSRLEGWTREFFATHRDVFQSRRDGRHIRECHGDLHLGNVVAWGGELVPFDGIEFSDDFRWIDTLSDAAFTAMDFAARDRLDCCHSFVNSYFEVTGDYGALAVLRWYLVFRAMVRAKVAAMRASQVARGSPPFDEAVRQLQTALNWSSHFATPPVTQPTVWITHGLSGSGKTTGAEHIVQRTGAIRIRADVERKRMAGMLGRQHATDSAVRADDLYSQEMTERTYRRLTDLAAGIVACGFSVIADATFLRKWQRQMFVELAQHLHAPLRILVFEADPGTLRQRLAERRARQCDLSDADEKVLDAQLATREELDDDERALVDPSGGNEPEQIVVNQGR